MSMDIRNPVMRLAMVAFGLFFSGVAVVALISNFNAMGIATSAVMIAAGLWIVGMGVISVKMQDGAQVGGGPLMPAVRLERDEGVLANCTAIYDRMDKAPRGPESYKYLQGHVFLTDRRLIFSPLRFRFVARPVVLALGDVVSTSVAHRKVQLLDAEREVLEIHMSDGSAHAVWFGDPAVRDQVMEPPSRPRVAARTLIPARETRFWHVIVESVISVVALASLVGSRSEPYIRQPSEPIVWVFVLFFAVLPLVGIAYWAKAKFM